MIFTETTPRYNERRYGKPWIARLDFKRPGKPEYIFGSWLGQPGQSGELSIEVAPGDVIATGQKDHRKGRGGADHVGVIQPDGKAIWGYTLASARDAGKAVRETVAAIPAAGVDMEALQEAMLN